MNNGIKANQARTKIRAGIFTGICVCVIAALIYAYWVEWRFERVKISGGIIHYVDEYEEYYYKVKGRWERGWFGGSYVKTLYFLPGQKRGMLEKIKEDIQSDLESLIKEHGDVFYRYEMSDVLHWVNIYEVANAMYWRSDVEINELTGRISFLIGLYHNVKEGKSIGIYGIFNIIKSDN